MASSSGKWARFFFWFKVSLFLLLVVSMAGLVLLAAQEMRTSAYQARFFAGLASKAQFELGEGPSPAIRFPASAPFDDRLGYAQLPAFLDRLDARGFDIRLQARISPGMAELLDEGYFAPYREKLQAGLNVRGCRAESLYGRQFPARVIERFEDLPPAWVYSLLFIENRELLDASQPRRNPAVEWNRLAYAVFSAAQGLSGDGGGTPGGSTLATQIEKYRHSPEGRTGSMGDKLRQMVSASLRAYQQGEDTTEARQQVVVAYLNTMPLSAKAGFGEVHGIGDGLWAWYGRDFDEVQRILREADRPSDDGAAAALLYKQVLSLLISQRRPSHYLVAPMEELENITNQHLRLLADARRDFSPRSGCRAGPAAGAPCGWGAVGRGGVHRAESGERGAHPCGWPAGYEPVRPGPAGSGRAEQLRRPGASGCDPVAARCARTRAGQGARAEPEAAAWPRRPEGCGVSFNLYERVPGRNLLRVQTDNFDQPLNVNQGSKLDLGSTAKLRTLVTYLDAIQRLHARLSGLEAEQLRGLDFDRRDALSQWAVAYLLKAPEKSLAAHAGRSAAAALLGEPGRGVLHRRRRAPLRQLQPG